MKKYVILFLTILFVSISLLALLPVKNANADTIHCDKPKDDTCIEGTTPEGGTWTAKGVFRMEIQE
ncbi:MAG: hypothetical protein DRJ07_02645 [Bacteroidetes bacterium]|nr:MAG: hypothetical protein DRJ07_02645 [Bacteroidota bacterium]